LRKEAKYPTAALRFRIGRVYQKNEEHEERHNRGKKRKT
jgi:hypothetical protein